MSLAQRLRITLLGLPGGGKGTVAAALCKRYELAHVSTGDLLRDASRNNEKVKQILARGELVPTDVTLDLMMSTDAIRSGKSFLLDGMPRSAEQARHLHERLHAVQQPLTHVIKLQVDPQVIWEERVKPRLVHAPSGRTYHETFKPPKVAGKDDVTGEPLSRREDDREEVVMRRLEIASENMDSIWSFYTAMRPAERPVTYEVPAPSSPDAIAYIEHLFAEEAKMRTKMSKGG